MSNRSQAEGEGHNEEGLEQTQEVNLVPGDMVGQIWNSQDPLTDLFEVYSSFFNPSHDPEYDVVDDNEIMFLAEFQIYNMIFCKNDLKLDDNQTSEVLNVMWHLLAINQDGSIQDHSLPAEGNFQEALNNKFEELRVALISLAKQGVLNKDQLKHIMTYMKSGYFKHFRLIDFVLRNRQLPTMKHITLFHDEPLIQKHLDTAKEIVDEPMYPAREGEGELEAEGEEGIDVDKDPLDGLEDRLNQARLDENSKNEVKSKLQDYNKEINSKLENQKKELGGKKK